MDRIFTYPEPKSDCYHTAGVYPWVGTPWKFDIGPENIPSQMGSSLPTIIFEGRAVKLRGCNYNYNNWDAGLIYNNLAKL